MDAIDGVTSSGLNSESYEGYAGLPPLIGLLSMKNAMTKGLDVEESVNRLKRFHWSLKRLHTIFISRISAMPIYELKMAFSLHAHYCIEHVGVMADRVREMRQPPYGLESVPNASLDIFFDEILAASSTPALVLALYEVAIPAIVSGLGKYLSERGRDRPARAASCHREAILISLRWNDFDTATLY